MQMNRRTYLALYALVFMTIGCKKLEPPVVPTDEPDFAVQFLVEGQDTSFTAGVDDYYMFSDFEKMSNDLHVFTGEIRDVNCEADCPNSLKIKIYDIDFAPASNINIEERIVLDTDYEYAIVGLEDTIYQMVFTPDLPAEATGNYDYIWTIDGENFAQETVEISRANPFQADACLEIIDTDNICNGNICKDVEFNQMVDIECFAQIIIADTLPGLDSVRLTVATSDGLLPNSISWNTGDMTDTIGVNMGGTFSFTGNTNFCPIAGEGRLNGDLTEPLDVFFCTPDFQTESTRQITPIPDAVLGKVVIEYIDADGIFYSSINNENVDFSNFTITSLETYDRNERDQATVILEVQFSTAVTSEAGISLEIFGGSGTIAVAYPD